MKNSVGVLLHEKYVMDYFVGRWNSMSVLLSDLNGIIPIEYKYYMDQC